MKTKALISDQLRGNHRAIFVFTYAKRWFSHDAAQICDVYHADSCIYGMAETMNENLLQIKLFLFHNDFLFIENITWRGMLHACSAFIFIMATLSYKFDSAKFIVQLLL